MHSPLGDLRPLPDTVWQHGREWKVETRARAVLRILRMLRDESLAPAHRAALLLRWFYPQGAPPEPLEPFRAFLTGGLGQDETEQDETEQDETEGDDVPDFDYEQDAAEIAAGFQAVYGIDLWGEGGGMHWWRFRALLAGLFAVDCALSAKVRLRKMNPQRADAATRRMIERVQLVTPQSQAQRRLNRQIERRLEQGLGIEDLINPPPHSPVDIPSSDPI